MGKANAINFALAVLALIVLATLFVPRHDPLQPNLLALELPPTAAHWLGTDALGRDVAARLLAGGRVSLLVGLGAVGLAGAAGACLGLLAGTLGGAVDGVIMRAADAIYSFPVLPLAVAIAAAWGPGLLRTVALIGLLSWPAAARLVRAECLSLREQEYVQAAVAAGASRWRIGWRHLLPGALPPLLVWAGLNVGGAILAEAGLSFLGLGVPPPAPSWGNMLAAAQSLRVLRSEWWLWLPPGLAVFVTVLALNLLADAFRDALDPRH